jgi:hypothetical protein
MEVINGGRLQNIRGGYVIKSASNDVGGTYLEEYPNVSDVLSARDKLSGNFFITGLDWTRTDLLQEELDRIENCDLVKTYKKSDRTFLLVMHQVCSCFMGDEQAELKDGMIPDCVDMLVLGDYHLSCLSSIKTKRGKEIPVISPGGTHIRRISEDPVKYVFVLYNDGSVARIPLKTRMIITIEINNADESEIREQVLNIIRNFVRDVSLPGELQKPLLYVRYRSSDNPEVRRIIDLAVEDEFHVFYRDLSQGVTAISADDLTEQTAVMFDEPAAQALNVLTKSEQDEHVQTIVKTLLHRENTEAVYQELQESFIQSIKNA